MDKLCDSDLLWFLRFYYDRNKFLLLFLGSFFVVCGLIESNTGNLYVFNFNLLGFMSNDADL